MDDKLKKRFLDGLAYALQTDEQVGDHPFERASWLQRVRKLANEHRINIRDLQIGTEDLRKQVGEVESRLREQMITKDKRYTAALQSLERAYEARCDELRAQIDYLAEHAAPGVRQRCNTIWCYRWRELDELATSKLGAGWRDRLPKVANVTKRRVEIWREGRDLIPDGIFARLRALPDEPDRPEPKPAAERHRSTLADRQARDEYVNGLDNILHAASDMDLADRGRVYASSLDSAHANYNEVGLNLGRIAAELTRRFKALRRAQQKAHGGLAVYLETLLGKDKTTVQRWVTAAGLIDGDDPNWEEVSEWCARTGFTTPASGPEAIKAMFKAFMARADSDGD